MSDLEDNQTYHFKTQVRITDKSDKHAQKTRRVWILDCIDTR